MSIGVRKVKRELMNIITPIESEVFYKSWLYNPNILGIGSVKQGCDI
jgi:hypothetical protein